MLNFRKGPATTSLALLAILVFSGCAGRHRADAFPRPFDFHNDVLAYPNELKWVYRTDPVTGNVTHEPRRPEPTYALHCFVVAKTARLFFQHARFDATLPRQDEATYRALVRRIVKCSPREERSPEQRIVIPGFANLREFSVAHEALLKAETGTPWACYFQRGNWRMVWLFSRRHQEKMAAQLVASLRRNRPPVVHLSDFPKVSINHAVVVIDAREDRDEIAFTIYDPNDPSVPARLRFDRTERRFYFPANSYFAGGRLHVYEVYHTWDY
ncbi:MAG: hypothetical protein QOF48_3238 [Verrucomicrobiota bacterium]|jgi:hypothetical protein